MDLVLNFTVTDEVLALGVKVIGAIFVDLRNTESDSMKLD